MDLITFIVAAAFGLLLSWMGIVFAMLSGPDFAFLIGGLLAVAHIGAFIFARKKAMRGKTHHATLILISPLFLVISVGSIFSICSYVVSLLVPDSPAFTAECQAAGAQYYKLPTSPVHSIAYDWAEKQAPTYNYVQFEFGSRISSLGYSNFPYPSAIEFTERKHSDREGLPVGAPGPYVRFPKQGPFYGITTLTADVLVEYRLTPEEELKKSATEQGMIRYDLTVTDRRNGEKLASLRYIIDAKNRRACGTTENNAINERTFVLKAIGIQ